MRMDYLCGHWVCVCLSRTHANVKEREKGAATKELHVRMSEEKGEKKLWHEWFAATATFPARYLMPTPHGLHVLRFLLCMNTMYAWKTHHHESFMECNVITNDLKCNAPSAHSFAWYFLFSDPINAFIHIIIYCCVCWQPERRSAICHAMANECVHRRMSGVLFSYNAF